MTTIRLVNMDELSIAMDIIDQAKAYLRAQGIDQWQDGYPDETSIRQDIEARRGYFLLADDAVAGYLCVDFGGEPAYADIRGAWLTAGAYAVVHRLALHPAFRGQGLAGAAFDLAAQLCRARGVSSLRADTDACNQRMQQALRRSGFICCGTIFFQGGDKVAFEKQL